MWSAHGKFPVRVIANIIETWQFGGEGAVVGFAPSGRIWVDASQVACCRRGEAPPTKPCHHLAILAYCPSTKMSGALHFDVEPVQRFAGKSQPVKRPKVRIPAAPPVANPVG
jgi:hypothetical protein